MRHRIAITVLLSIFSVARLAHAGDGPRVTIEHEGRTWTAELVEITSPGPTTQPAVPPAATLPALPPVVSVDPTLPAPARTFMRPTTPLAGAVIEIRNADIDCSAVGTKLVTLQRGQRVLFENCVFVNANSIVEGHSEGTSITFRNCMALDRTDAAGKPVAAMLRYFVYLESKDAKLAAISDHAKMPKAANVVTIDNCDIGSSAYETPVRTMYGVETRIVGSRIRDRIDVGSDKANGAVRLHCYSGAILDSEIEGLVKLGHADFRAKFITIQGTKIEGKGIYIEGVDKIEAIDTTYNGSPWKRAA